METIITNIVNGIMPVIDTLAKSLLSFQMVMIVLGTLGATHILKLLIKYSIKDPQRAAIWLVLTPLVALPLSWIIWDGDKNDWIVVGLSASPLSNVVFWIGMKFVSKVSPTAAAFIQDPVQK